jgi:LPXTG-motif cell wall-anchored protein
MSTNKVIGSSTAAAATLPVTGSPALTVALIGAGLVMAGLLLFRAGRIRRSA